jgi:phosphoglycerol transferase MdoB-like AlkP superfamily enzyme
MSEIKVEDKRKAGLTVLSVIRMLLLPALGVFVLQALSPYRQRFDESVYFDGDWYYLLGNRFFWNYIILVLMYAILYFLPYFKVSSIVMSTIVFVFGLAEHYVILFRNTIIFPWDLDSIGLAANVSGTYDFSITTEMILAAVLYLLMIVLSFLGKDPRMIWQVRLITVILLLGIGTVYMTNFVMNKSKQIDSGITFYFTTVNYNIENGVLLNFFYHMRFLMQPPPEGYNRSAVEQDLASYHSTITSLVPGGEKPDIIMIMSEAFSDLEVISEFSSSEPVMPFWDSLSGQKNCIQKTLMTSAFGGNTANAEFEVLTGMSMQFFSPGTYPYKHYIRNNVPSFASLLASNGYSIYSIHPFNLTGWNRQNVMPLLGFPIFEGEDAFSDPERFRTYISDMEAYDQVIQKYEEMKNADPDQPIFEYLMTIQNHGGYASDDALPYNVSISADKAYPQAEQYLSLLRLSDDALSQLISYFEKVDHPTVIILYGDHQPNLGDGFQDYLNLQVDVSNKQKAVNRYKTQLLVWANYDISSSELTTINEEMISSNYVTTFLSDIIGIERTPFQAFEAEMYKNIPAMNLYYIVAPDGTIYDAGSDTIPSGMKDWIKKFEMFQHYSLYDVKENR